MQGFTRKGYEIEKKIKPTPSEISKKKVGISNKGTDRK